ncbi:MAG: SagB/ThcOx family dehydrogenase [Actinomycetota bacterium]|nr:SagB/ThcOx family dehydrogenase [Actinomycetota bacterium]
MNWRSFHAETNHGIGKISGTEHDPDVPEPMDPARKPHPFKNYSSGRNIVQLADDKQAWLEGVVPPGLDLGGISRLLVMGAGSKRYRNPQLRSMSFRTYASAGALHPNEVYVATCGVPGLGAGLYHFHPRDKILVMLGDGDPRSAISGAAGDQSLLETPVIFIVTGIPWRTSWKYRERGYRHLWWDAGMIIANIMALADSVAIPSKVSADFIDSQIDNMLDIDGATEMSLALISLGTGGARPASSLTSFALVAEPIGPEPFEFTRITEVHASTALHEIADRPVAAPASGVAIPGEDSIDKTIWRRGSVRRLDPEATTTTGILADVLRYTAAPWASDWGGSLCDLFVVVNGVDGLQRGVYRWSDNSLSLVKVDEESRDIATGLSLGQDLGGDGAFVVFPMADLDDVTAKFGDRGYRVAQLEGAIVSGRIYLAAYAVGLAASGLTFFDEEVSKYLGAKGLPMLEVSVGKPLPRRSPKPPGDSPANLDLTASDENALPMHWEVGARGYEVVCKDATLEISCMKPRGRAAAVSQTVKAEAFRGKKLTLSANIQTDLPDDSMAGIFLSVSVPDAAPLHNDMWDTPIKGKTPFSAVSIDIEVPEEAESIMFGLWMFNVGSTKFRMIELKEAGE